MQRKAIGTASDWSVCLLNMVEADAAWLEKGVQLPSILRQDCELELGFVHDEHVEEYESGDGGLEEKRCGEARGREAAN